MSAPVTPARPLDPRLAGLPDIAARKLAQLPPAWLDQLRAKHPLIALPHPWVRPSEIGLIVMPKFSLAFWENRIREDLATQERSTIKKLAKLAKLAKRQFEEFTKEPTDDEMLELYSTITYADPTPYDAIRNINAENAVRRLAA